MGVGVSEETSEYGMENNHFLPAKYLKYPEVEY